MLIQVGKRFVSEQHDIDPDFANGMMGLLCKSRVFKDCHREFIRELIVASNRKVIPPNRYLIEEGDRGDSMYVLYKGVVEVSSQGRYICTRRDGSIVGEAALLMADNRRTASVLSVQRCDVAIIFRSTFYTILEKFPWEKRKFQREMKAKLLELGKLVDIRDDINLEQQGAYCDSLRKVPFFAGDEANDFVAELAMNGSASWFRPGHVIIQEADTKCDEMYVIISGAVEVTACGEFLGRLENDLFGEICVLDLLERRTATVTAATQCQCIVFRRQMLLPILAKYPDARMRFLEHARHRLVALNDTIGGGAAETTTRALGDSLVSLRSQGCAVGFGGAVKGGDAHLLAASRIFRDAPLDFLRGLSERMATKSFEEGVTICHEGQRVPPGEDFVHWIAKGQVEVWKGKHFVTLLGEGDIFGELAATKGGWQQATVKAKTPVICRAVRSYVLQELLINTGGDELRSRWKAEMDRRVEQLAQKEQLDVHLRARTEPIDIMFMKLQATSEDGALVPKTAPLGPMLNEVGKGRVNHAAILAVLEPPPTVTV